MNLEFLTPELFNALVIAVIVVGLVWAALRIRGDFRRGPRWPEDEGNSITPATGKGDTPVKGQGQP